MNSYSEYEYENCAVGLPYPEVTRGQDPYAVSLLMEDYSGIHSELTAIMQYFYVSTQLLDCWEAAYTAFRKISIVEMRHLDLLAKAITAKCGDPCFVMNGCRGHRQFWNAAAVQYDRNPCKALLLSIEGEQGAIAQYGRHIQCIQDESVRELLRRIILDEELHIQIFSDLYHQCRCCGQLRF